MPIDLILDPDIRLWVFLPIVLITYFVENIRYHVTILLNDIKISHKLKVEQARDLHILLRLRALQENHGFIPEQAFQKRRQAFNRETGYLSKKTSRGNQQHMYDPKVLTHVLKDNVTNVIPMVMVGGWVNWLFSGFVTTKVPFPLTVGFKPMLQRGIELTDLDSAWVSSISWYLLNIFGQKNICYLLFSKIGDEGSAEMTEEVPDENLQAKEEWEALEIIKYKPRIEELHIETLIL